MGVSRKSGRKGAQRQRSSVPEPREHSESIDLPDGSWKINDAYMARGVVRKALEEEARARLGIQSTFLTQAQWERLRDGANFRPGAIFELNEMLREYWANRLEEEIDKSIFDKIDASRELLLKSANTLNELISDPDFFKGPLHFDHSMYDERCSLLYTVAHSQMAANLLVRARARLKSAAKKTWYGPIHILLGRLDLLLYRQHGSRLSRSDKLTNGKLTPVQLVRELVEIADSKIPDGTVDHYLKEYIKQQRRGGAHIQKREADNFKTMRVVARRHKKREPFKTSKYKF